MSSQHASAHQNPPTWTEPPWSGWIETTGDALLILEAARRGLIPRVTRRLVDSERKMITSGSVFVFDEDESGIKRWTDGFFWSPSRILGNFLLYRETDKRGAGNRSGKEGEVVELDAVKADGSLSRPKSDPGHPGVDKQRERTLVGSLTNSYKFKPDGLMKKTFSLTIGGVAQHLISYYKIEDVESGRLRPPSSLPELASLEISPEYLDKTHFRNPPKVEVGADGIPRYRGEADDIDTSASLLTGPPLTGLPLLTGGREVPESAASKRIKRFEPYGQPSVPAPKRQRKTPVPKAVPIPADGSQPQAQTQQDVVTPITASPTSPQQVQAPQAFTDANPAPATSPPAPAAPAASYPSFGVAPYYGYMQPPPPHMPMYPHQPGYPISPGQSMPPPPAHPGQYSYGSYPPPAPQAASTTTSPPSTNSPPDPARSQPSGTSASPAQPQPPVNPQMQPQPGYYHPHAPPPHPYYPPPHAQPAPPHPHPQMYPGYPPHPSHHPAPPAPPPAAVWGPPPPHHPHPYGAYPPPPHQNAPPPPPPPQSYPYPNVYPAPPQQPGAPTQQQQQPSGQYPQPYQAQQAEYVQQAQAFGATPTQGGVTTTAAAPARAQVGGVDGLKTNGATGREREGDDGGASD